MPEYSDQSFQDRLQRISQAQQLREAKQPARPGRARRFLANTVYPLSFLVASASGLIAVFAARYLRFHLVGDQSGGAVSGTAMDIVVSIIACWAVKQMFSLDAPEFKAAQAAGIFALAFSFHNLAHWQPDMMEALFSEDWVTQQQQYAPANSISLAGLVVAFGR